MSAHSETCRLPESSHRRGFLKASGAITAMALLGATTFRSITYAAALTKAQRDKLTPDDVLALMKSGNKRFYTGKRENQKLSGAAARDRRGSVSSCGVAQLY